MAGKHRAGHRPTGPTCPTHSDPSDRDPIASIIIFEAFPPSTVSPTIKMKTKKYIIPSIVAIILILAFLLRLNFFSNYRQAPVVWDAAGYNIQAKEFTAAFSAWPDREAFLTHFKKAYEMALPKCELYPLFLSGVYLIQGADFDSARVAQAILGVLSILLLYLIASRLINRRVALISIIIAAVYIPFIISEGRLLTETLAIFVFMLTTWILVHTIERGSWWLILLAGFSTALMVITRTFFQYIYLFYWPMLVIGLAAAKMRSTSGKKLRFPIRLLRALPWKSLFFILAMAVIIVPRLFWTPQVDRYHRSFISGSWRNGLAMYCGVYPPNRGLQTTASPGGEILRSTKVEPGPGASEDKLFKASVQLLLRNPLEVLPVLLAKGQLFYQRAYNDFLQSYILSPGAVDIFNRILLIAGLFGAFLLPVLGIRGWPIIVALVYGWGICFLADAESRYTLPLMPFMIMTAVWFFDRIVGTGLKLWRGRKGNLSRLIIFLLISGVLLLLAIFGRPAFTMAALPGLSFVGAHRIRVIFVSLFLLSLILPLLFIYQTKLRGWRRYLAAIGPVLFILLVYLSALKVHPSWHEWSVRLNSPEQVVRQTINLPENLKNYRSVDLKLDLVSGPNRRYDLTISIDGEVVRRFEGGLTPDPASWVPPDKRRAFPIYLRATKRKMPDIRQWYTVPLDIKKLEGRRTVEVEIRFSPVEADEGCYVDLFGDYSFGNSRDIFEGPTFSKSPSRLSLYKYLFDDDWRIWEEFAVAPTAGESYIGPGKSRSDDLSPGAGIQSGAFRVFLELSRRKAPPAGFSVAVKHQDYLTDKSILADYYNLQIWEVNPWKRKSDYMLLEAAHAAPGQEGGFNLIVYADTDRDGKPDKLVSRSSYLTAEKKGEWSSFTFATEEKNIYVGLTWPKGSKTRVYYERLLWPDDLFPETMFYRTGPNAPTAYPVLTNMRLRFLK